MQHKLVVAQLSLPHTILCDNGAKSQEQSGGSSKGKCNRPLRKRMITEGSWDEDGSVDNMWMKMVTCIQKVAREVLGVTKGKKHEAMDTWWWNEDVQKAIKEKECYKSWQHDTSTINIVKYKEAKKNGREP
jgi:hypothetical protein